MNDIAELTTDQAHQCAGGTFKGRCQRTTHKVVRRWSSDGSTRTFHMLPLCPQHRIPGKSFGMYLEAAI